MSSFQASAARYLQQCVLNHQQSPRQLFSSKTSPATTPPQPQLPPSTTTAVTTTTTTTGNASVGTTKTAIDKYEFAIRHYAGQVWYDCGQFVEKNRLQIKWETIKLLTTSKNSVKYLIYYFGNN